MRDQDSDDTFRLNFMTFCTQVFRRKIPVEVVSGKNRRNHLKTAVLLNIERTKCLQSNVMKDVLNIFENQSTPSESW